MKRILKKITGYLVFSALLIICLTLYIAYIKHEPALTAIKEDAKNFLSFSKQTDLLKETEESKAIDRAIAVDSGLIIDPAAPTKTEPSERSHGASPVASQST
ncbi:MAG: hypothetical protein K2W94_07600 [Alphaproteobacteria bacterium]|nr:hypothetical protein [Alphaproteobacteria bacterium]